MTPAFPPADGTYPRLSRLTLALMEDSGWYVETLVCLTVNLSAQSREGSRIWSHVPYFFLGILETGQLHLTLTGGARLDVIYQGRPAVHICLAIQVRFLWIVPVTSDSSTGHRSCLSRYIGLPWLGMQTELQVHANTFPKLSISARSEIIECWNHHDDPHDDHAHDHHLKSISEH